MFIQTEATGVSTQLKFLPGRDVLPGQVLSISDRNEAECSPLAKKLFEIPGVTGLSFGPDYITVTKGDGEWQHLKPALLGVIMEHFMSGTPLVREPPADKPTSVQPETAAEKIKNALRRVTDPELGYNIIDLGLVYDVQLDSNGLASVIMTTTTPGCPATNYLIEGAKECTASVKGVETAEITLTYEPRWTPELMSDEAKVHFGIR
jgi:metal-sulfur cluster biosynthetic enzyme